MNLFDATGVILIAVDDKFTLEDKNGFEVNKGSIHRQFLDKYYTTASGHKDEIAKTIANRGESTEVAIEIGDKTFVLFAYSTQGNREDYSDEIEYRLAFIEIDGSLEKIFSYCKENFPNKVINSALIGAGVQMNRVKGLKRSISECENRINNLANELGLSVNLIKQHISI